MKRTNEGDNTTSPDPQASRAIPCPSLHHAKSSNIRLFPTIRMLLFPDCVSFCRRLLLLSPVNGSVCHSAMVRHGGSGCNLGLGGYRLSHRIHDSISGTIPRISSRELIGGPIRPAWPENNATTETPPAPDGNAFVCDHVV